MICIRDGGADGGLSQAEGTGRMTEIRLTALDYTYIVVAGCGYAL